MRIITFIFLLAFLGKLFPYHFVRPQDKDTISQFYEDLNNKRLSVTTPFDLLQKSECGCRHVSYYSGLQHNLHVHVHVVSVMHMYIHVLA